jgi:hypothetical protein
MEMFGGHSSMTHNLILLGCHPYTLDIGNLDHGIMLGFDRDDWVCFHFDTSDELRCGITFFHHSCTASDDTWPWRGPPIPLDA